MEQFGSPWMDFHENWHWSKKGNGKGHPKAGHKDPVME
jgi:hypothetical protein